LKDRLHGDFGLGLRNPGALHNLIDNIELDHCNLLKRGDFILENGFAVVKVFLLYYDSSPSG
jgi:hypothetical protein